MWLPVLVKAAVVLLTGEGQRAQCCDPEWASGGCDNRDQAAGGRPQATVDSL